MTPTTPKHTAPPVSTQGMFRGISVNAGEWVYGDLLHMVIRRNGIDENKVFIGVDKYDGYDMHDVDPSTIGQYTQLNANKTPIYAGDKLKFLLPESREERIGVVRYEPGCGGYIVEWGGYHVLLNLDVAFEAEVVGNVHEDRGGEERKNNTLPRHTELPR